MLASSNRARDRKPIHKSEGITPSERYMNGLCESTFLSLWSYPGIFRDQKRKGKGDGKELCDLLVVFGDHILIFSDKHCIFPSTGDLEADWKRWYKRAIAESANQVWGAERWLKSHPNRIYLDRACAKPFPLKIPSPDKAKCHLIIVAHGSEERCVAELGGQGSLIFASSLAHTRNGHELVSTPFMVGDLDRSKTFIHILTEFTLNILLQTLDTISDFVWYLEKKEKFIRTMTTVIVPGEEELLAYYLAHINDHKEHDFVINGDFNGFMLEEGLWDDFCKSFRTTEAN